MRIHKGYIEVPDSPGPGVEIDLKKVEAAHYL
jgi:L-alanine-DL-glutamate epimerase-like enolase superfamily enzyme